MSDLRETIAKAICDSDEGGWPVLRWHVEREQWLDQADAVLAAIAKDAVIVDRERWERVEMVARAAVGWHALKTNPNATFHAMQIQALSIRDATDGLKPTDLAPLP